MTGGLSEYFVGIGAKRLSDVEVKPATSNQHEFNGITELKKIFGQERMKFDGTFIYLCDEDDNLIESKGTLTWYDARENHPTRSEHRLYYSSNDVLAKANAGDLLILAKRVDDLVVIIAKQGSTAEKQMLWLFQLEQLENRFIIKEFQKDHLDLNFAGKYIVQSLGIEVKDKSNIDLQTILNKFGNSFPSTIDFSKYARDSVRDVSPIEDPDNALLVWLEREESLFKTLEKHIISERLKTGFMDNVDEFISFSLSVQNRRKARAGFALENHLAELFTINNITYSKGKKTERNNKPDFIFPNIDSYHNESFNINLLTMLGVKTTAKDRWRQVLSEAEKIGEKHLITLEPSISKNQTDEMKSQNLQLVMPLGLFETYSMNQQKELICLKDFVTLVLKKQVQIA